MTSIPRRIRMRKGSANLARVRGHTVTLAKEMLQLQGMWESEIRADEQERNGFGHVDELEHDLAALTRWKAEATAVIEEWEQVHRLLGSPGFIGESKAAVTYDEVRDLIEARGDLRAARAEVEEMRAERDGPIRAWHERGQYEGRRDVLADLRAKVEGLPLAAAILADETGKALASTALPNTMHRSAVLALIDEAGR